MRRVEVKCPNGCSSYMGPLVMEYEDDGVECDSCGKKTPNPHNSRKQKEMAKNVAGNLQHPQLEVARAVAYSSMIYGMATHGDTFDSGKSEIERQIASKWHAVKPEQVQLLTSGGRAIREVQDKKTGYMMIRVQYRDLRLLYIVFRGSRSDTPGSKANPDGAGFGHTRNMQRQNVDYVANFSGRVDAPWWAPGVRVRRGFYELYSSMYYEIDRRVAEQLNEYGDTQVIVTGHSLGAAMSVVCAHHLQCELGATMKGGGPFCYPFCTPRVGDYRFAASFRDLIAGQAAALGDDRRVYSRCLSFCMDNDPVSNKGDKGYKRDHSDRDTRQQLSQGSRKANAGFASKVIYGMRKKTDSSIQFYKTPNVYQFGWYAIWNVHSYKQCQKKFLGRVLFTH